MLLNLRKFDKALRLFLWTDGVSTVAETEREAWPVQLC